MSGRRGSNPRPRPWQGRALPAELLSLMRYIMLVCIIIESFHFLLPCAATNVTSISEIQKDSRIIHHEYIQ
jgi:hypothetical protein